MKNNKNKEKQNNQYYVSDEILDRVANAVVEALKKQRDEEAEIKKK
ncbi:hypothetical protein KJ937_04640 [Patescibacteria group bacterium]|nr:hypothetical protein [Patescibacteria group bacterium]